MANEPPKYPYNFLSSISAQQNIKAKKPNTLAISPQIEVTFIFFRIGFILSSFIVV